jgi:branched-chain amino acid transport system ATP-binding protein
MVTAPAEGDGILRVEALTKRFGGVAAVEDVSFRVAHGKVTSLIGPNGAGKTTVFNLITGIVEPTSGDIWLATGSERPVLLTQAVFDPLHAVVVSVASVGLGVLAAAVPAARRWLYYRPRTPDAVSRHGIGRTFQNIRLFRDLSVLDNVKVGLHARVRSRALDAVLRTRRHRREEADIADAAAGYLGFVGLRDKASFAAGELAHGEQRRLEIARALASRPRLLLLDEPAAGLNPTETQALMRLIERIRDGGTTVLLIEHDMSVVMEVSDHVVVLDHGRNIAEGAPQEVRRNPAVIAAYLGVSHEDGPG